MKTLQSDAKEMTVFEIAAFCEKTGMRVVIEDGSITNLVTEGK